VHIFFRQKEIFTGLSTKHCSSFDIKKKFSFTTELQTYQRIPNFAQEKQKLDKKPTV